jgi:hypothetical protein
VHGDLHIASISMTKLASSALIAASIHQGSLSMYSTSNELHFDSTLVLCDELIVGSTNVSSRILQLLSNYPSRSNDWNSNTTTVACPAATTPSVPSIFKFASGISVRGSFNASSMIWAGRSVDTWLDYIEAVLLATTPAPTVAPIVLNLVKQTYTVSDSSGTPLAGSR